jgi:hypothetical protein
VQERSSSGSLHFFRFRCPSVRLIQGAIGDKGDGTHILLLPCRDHQGAELPVGGVVLYFTTALSPTKWRRNIASSANNKSEIILEEAIVV